MRRIRLLPWFLILVDIALNQGNGTRLSSNLVVVKIVGDPPREVAQRYGLWLASRVFKDESYYVLRSENGSITREKIDRMKRDPLIAEVLPQHLKERRTRGIYEDKIRYDKGGDIPEINLAHELYDRMENVQGHHDDDMTFNDPYFPDQWYLRNYGQTGSSKNHDLNVEKVWKSGFTGTGVTLSVLDDGIADKIDEIKQNFDAKVSFDYVDNEAHQDNEPLDNSHGTYCAAIIAAVANNSNCGIGVAYDAKVGGTRLLDGPVTDVQEALALSHALNQIDIFSASWGPSDDGSKVDGPNILARKAFQKGVTQGRSGKGVVYVWAAGNGGENSDNCNMDGYVSNIYSISVGALTAAGQNTYYSEPCSAVFASTYIGGEHSRFSREDFLKAITDIKVVVPNIHGECVESFQGTSAAAPMAAGIFALVLQANQGLTWRDMQHIVVRTAKIPSALPVPGGWWTNAAGYHFNLYQGFGVLDAARMVQMAQNWIGVSKQISRTVDCSPKIRFLEGNSKNTVRMKVDEDAEPASSRIWNLEHVVVTITLKHPRRGTLEVLLTSPSGTTSVLLTRRKNDNSTKGLENCSMMSVHFWGENPNGLWHLDIIDSLPNTYPKSARKLSDCKLKIFGTNSENSQPSSNPHVLRTNEVQAIVAEETQLSRNAHIKPNRNSPRRYHSVEITQKKDSKTKGKRVRDEEMVSVLYELYRLYENKMDRDMRRSRAMTDVWAGSRKLLRILAMLQDLRKIH